MFTAAIAKHPARAAALIGLLSVLTVVLIATTAVSRIRWQSACGESRFLTPGIGNFEMAGENPLWWFGSADAGSGGSLERALTPQQMSIYEPRFRRSYQIAQARKKALDAQFQTLLAIQKAQNARKAQGAARHKAAPGPAAAAHK